MKRKKRLALYETFWGIVIMSLGVYLAFKAAVGEPIVHFNAKALLSFAFFTGTRFVKAKCLWYSKKLHYVPYLEYVELITVVFLAVLTFIMMLVNFKGYLLSLLFIMIILINIKICKVIFFHVNIVGCAE